ncbi:pancreatic lipase-related protein 2-like [Ylistrum balloti]|uniref:pancreatic lipase-related protein 2-like n=1 Tax=Ylistrum balloti TaxID=509963 RepID=UPI002905DC89|nr:pancreatic lipase-related protein 2-like [Ylistrum balloti]
MGPVLLALWSCLLLGLGAATSLRHDRTKRSSHCYGDLGCFSNEYPFNNSDGALPLSPSQIRPTFLLFSERSIPSAPFRLVRNDRHNLWTSGFEASLPTKIIIHGFTQNGNVPWAHDMMSELIRKERMNVIIVDWGRGSGFPYTQAVANTRVVGAEVAAMISYLNTAAGTTNSQYHLIGHSLGAHVCGYVGEIVRGLGRITGLDPAEPNFEDTPVEVRLDSNDANFVDVIHTDGSEFDTISGYGMKMPCGDMDFYPNGGRNQPGCTHETWTNVVSHLELGPQAVGGMLACSHDRSIYLFTESINGRSCTLKGHPCQSYEDFVVGRCFSCGNQPCPSMGYHADSFRARGKFYLATTDSPPYCGNFYQVTVQFGPTMATDHGELHLRILGTSGLSEIFAIKSFNPQTGRDDGFQQNQERKVMLVSRSYLGDILNVQAQFQESRSLLSYFWTGEISLSRIMVTDGKTEARYLFCVGEAVLRAGQAMVGFNHAVHTVAECTTRQ